MVINATILGEIITFLVFIFIVMKFIWPPIVSAMEKRRQKIVAGLEAAEEGAEKLKKAKLKHDELICEAKNKSENILDEADLKANKIINRGKKRGIEVKHMIINEAEVNIEMQVEKALSNLNHEIVEVAILGIEKFLKQNIDRETHNKMVAELIEEIR